VRLVELGFPPDRREPRDALKVAVEAFDHTFQAAALELRIRRRGDKNANLSRAFCHGLLSRNCANSGQVQK
jgi:hypothetical protein